eukprot:Rmarinus@m.19385
MHRLLGKSCDEYARFDLCVRINSILHALIVTPIALKISYLSEETTKDVVFGRAPEALPLMAIGAGYQVYDLVMMSQRARIEKRLGRKPGVYTSLILHHVFIIALALTVFTVRYGDFFIGAFISMEASTPFVNLRAILSEFGLKKTFVYTFNSVCMMISFFLFRIVAFPAFFYIYGVQHDVSFLAVPFVIPKKCVICTTLLFGLNLYWFFLMMRGALRQLCGKHTDEEKAR